MFLTEGGGVVVYLIAPSKEMLELAMEGLRKRGWVWAVFLLLVSRWLD